MNPSEFIRLVEQLPSATAVLQGPDHVFVAVSGPYRHIIGGRDPVGRPLASVLPELRSQGFIELLDQVRQTGVAHHANGVPAVWDADGDGVAEPHLVDLVYSALRDESGAVWGIVAEVADVTEQTRREKEREFLAGASELLASSLDSDATLASVARLAVPDLAEWCAVDELAPDGSIRRIAVAHADPAKVELAYALDERHPPDLDAAFGVPHVLRTGEPELVADIPDELLVRAAVDAEHLAIMRSLGLGSYICVPLVARGRTLAALSFVQGRGARPYGEADLWLAQELARRAAIAIDNAYLFREAEEARDQAEATTAELEAQAEELQSQAAQLEEVQAQLETSNLELREANGRLNERNAETEEAWAVLDAFIEAAPTAVAFLDPELRYRWINGAMAGIEGSDPREVVGKSLQEVVPGLAPKLEPLYRRVLDNGVSLRNLEFSGPLPGDPSRHGHFLVNFFPVRVRGGPILGVGLVALDVTARREAQERERVFAEVLEESRNEIYLFDADTLHFDRVNRGARENLGYSVDEIRTMTPLDLKPEYTPAGFEALVRPLLRRETDMVRFETVHRRKDGTLYPVDVHLQLSEAGDRRHFVALIFDITARKETERELIQAKEAAEEANRVKSHFLATMSHELRTPLNAMIGYSDLLLEGLPVPIPDGARKSVERIGVSARHLLELIEEILSFARIEAGRERVKLARVELGALVKETCALVEPLAVRKGLDFTFDAPDEPITLETDARKVRQVLINLLGNAVKFTDRGAVALRARPEEDAMRFVIEDTGIGISPANLERIFEPFWQEETEIRSRAEGTGLGLPVSRRLLDLLGGTLAVESEPGKGTTCTVRLPLRPPI